MVGPMPLYFFHYKNGRIYEDEDGQMFANAKGAQCHAKLIASELAQGEKRPDTKIIVATDDEDDFEVLIPRWHH